MKNCYEDPWFLHFDMENMGYLFEYSDVYAAKLYDVKIDRMKFIQEFMPSRLRKKMEMGHATLLTQAAENTFRKFVEIDMDGDLSLLMTVNEEDNDFAEYQLYWVGWMYAYLHFKEDISSENLIKILPPEEMLKYYWTGHEMGEEAAYRHLKGAFEGRLL
ncbi:MAG: hypothetical protein LUE86_09210 [Clostridiales bacterium]|nr:hypothetical protein [Clostridiales bacterium]